MRIVFLHHANVCRGGIERVFCQKANYLAEQEGWQVTMLTYEQNGEPYPYELSPKVQCVNLNVRLYSAHHYALLLRPFKRWQLCRRLTLGLRRFLETHKTDVVVCTDKDAHEQHALLEARTSERLIVEAHTGMIDHVFYQREQMNTFRRMVAAWGVWSLKRTISRFDALIALTPDDARCWSPLVTTVCLPNALAFYPAQTVTPTADVRRVIAVGRLNHQKGFDLLLQAWAGVETAHPDWQLDIFGDGEDRDALNRQVQMLALRRAAIHPATPDIYDAYMQSSFLVCSSRWESFGLILIEAMSCGLPVVSFDCDNGPRNIITHGTDGLLARNGDVADLMAKMCQLIESPALRCAMSVEARQQAARYRKETVLRQYAQFYTSIIKSSGAQ